MDSTTSMWLVEPAPLNPDFAPSVFVEDLEDENDWTFEESQEVEEESSEFKGVGSLVDQNNIMSFSGIPPIPPPSSLHPAVSMGMHKVSSCYFSIGSHESMADLLSSKQQQQQQQDDAYTSCQFFDLSSDDHGDSRTIPFDSTSQGGDDLLYHDILMNVFTYLDAQSLASFSETARRPNFEVFYFLQLQLQRSLLVDHVVVSSNHHHHHHHDPLTAIAGSAILSRLAKLDPSQAQAIVEDYLQSNSTLRRMPLSHSIAYMRHFLQRQGFHHQFPEGSPSQALASAALLATVVGAAYLGGEMPQALSSGEVPNLLFRFGFVGSLMGAAHKMSDGEGVGGKREEKKEDNNDRQESTTTPQQEPATAQFRFPSLFEMKETLTATLRDGKHYANNHNHNNNNNNNNRPSARSTTTTDDTKRPMLSNPYDHYHEGGEEEKGEEKVDLVDENSTDETAIADPKEPRKMPSGCMGAYSRAIQSATGSIVDIVKQGRKNRFATMNTSEQARNVATLLDACSLNEGLSTVQELSHCMDLDAFYVGSDGSETCALHTAAFHGASKVVDFLLQGIDDADASRDGGLCLVDCRDSNGWTALHFAAGSNSVESVQVLARHGAKLSLEANNGYSPVQWARRLSNDEVEEALTELMQNESNQGWRSQPLTSLANRFFSLIPSR
ncbi:unnamed protein product [Cylindrotheca closterium]|uniref:Uncharacterized protein n=1 Tax=Cylindrotheca closterium TaxID=2856 RepID=A0AAD2PUB9_9STRA|nr:unnamed protein product [Cylindrotheca closterium]